MSDSGKKSAAKSVEPGSLVPGANNGLIRHGSRPGNTPGTGRPRDEFRAKLRKLSAGKGLPFLKQVLAGVIPVQFVGTCPKCKHECTDDDFSDKFWDHVEDAIAASVDHRLRANEQALKYGMGTQTEAVAPDEIRGQAQRMLTELCTILLDEEHWPVDKVQAVAARMSRAAEGKDA